MSETAVLVDTRFAGQVALVVGGRGGMGAVVAEQLRAGGAKVYVADRSPPTAESPMELVTDVCSEASVEAAYAHIEAHAGSSPDIVVFLAGIFEAQTFLESDEALYERLYRVNVFGGARVVRSAGRRMRAQKRGSIVVVASQSACVVRQGQAVYGSSKAALSYLTKVAALELGPYGVRCNLVMPGVTETPMARAVWDSGKGSAEAHIAGDLQRYRNPIPLGRVAQSEDVAAAVLFLASAAAKHITMTEIVVDGGSSLVA